MKTIAELFTYPSDHGTSSHYSASMVDFRRLDATSMAARL